MSSFKRKTPIKQLLPGTQPSPGSPSTLVVSSGIPSFDDILGGGLPLSCSLLINAPDPHSSYSELVQKYYIAQGLQQGQNVLLIHHYGQEVARQCMWTGSSSSAPPHPGEDESTGNTDKKIKIAWRYGEMKQFQTTVTNQASDQFCSSFDLTCRIPASFVDHAISTKQLDILDIGTLTESTTVSAIKQIEQKLAESNSSIPFRVCIADFGSPEWGNLVNTDVALFLFQLRVLLRRYSHACASVSLVPRLGLDSWGGSGWSVKLGWLVDASVTLSAFCSNPALAALSPSHHGLFAAHTLPAPHTLLSSSDKHSILRGLASAATSAGGTGENNLAFKCTRKRLIFETLHLDVEGGVSDRRTTPSNLQTEEQAHERPKAAFASVDVRIDEPSPLVTATDMPPSVPKVMKPKKRVAFHSDRPDLYDF